MKHSDALTTSGTAAAEKNAEKEARERVAQIKSFYSHLAVFLVAHTMMIGIYLLSGGGHFWPLYSIFGWGIGLASHAASTFDMFGMYGKSWEERKTREIMLQQEHGLSADEVRALLKSEIASERKALPPAEEFERMRRRLENLEAIVTSRDWDELPSHAGPLRKDVDEDALDEPAESEDPTTRAARLANRVR